MAPDKQSAVDPKTLSSVTQILMTPNADTVMQGIELVRSLDDEALCEALRAGKQQMSFFYIVQRRLLWAAANSSFLIATS